MNATSPSYDIIEIGHPVLAQVAEPVENFSAEVLNQHIDAMFSLMEARGGVGIAAPQIGVSLQMMVIASRPNARYPNAPTMAPLLLLNPNIRAHSSDYIEDWEGCLSVPGIRGRVSRPDAVDVEYQDRFGQPVRCRFDGFVARIFQHEFDHLVGKTFLDRVASPAALYSEKEYMKIVNGGGHSR